MYLCEQWPGFCLASHYARCPNMCMLRVEFATALVFTNAADSFVGNINHRRTSGLLPFQHAYSRDLGTTVEYRRNIPFENPAAGPLDLVWMALHRTVMPAAGLSIPIARPLSLCGQNRARPAVPSDTASGLKTSALPVRSFGGEVRAQEAEKTVAQYQNMVCAQRVSLHRRFQRTCVRTNKVELSWTHDERHMVDAHNRR